MHLRLTEAKNIYLGVNSIFNEMNRKSKIDTVQLPYFISVVLSFMSDTNTSQRDMCTLHEFIMDCYVMTFKIKMEHFQK